MSLRCRHCQLLGVLLAVLFHPSTANSSEVADPTVMIVMLIRNKEPFLPYTLTQLGELDYPKERLTLWLRSDHNEDATPRIVNRWLEEFSHLYHDVDAAVDTTSPRLRSDETGPTHHSDSRYAAVIEMKEEALLKARELKVDFVWFLDADVLLYDKAILRTLIKMEKPLVAPMLVSTERFSNFWAGMDDSFYYRRTERYSDIYEREEKGCFDVPMIHSCVLVDLREHLTKSLTFVKEKLQSPVGPSLDDVITFAISAQQTLLAMHVCNQEEYGQVPVPLEESDDLILDWVNLAEMKVKALTIVPHLPVTDALEPFLPPPLEKSTLGFDHIYIISLERRQARRKRATTLFNELGIDADIINAFDGRKLNESYMLRHNITMLSGYRDPILKRPLTYGEVGCFLSHHSIWTDIVRNDYRRAIVFEDDAHPPLDFERKLTEAVDELDRLHPDWDLLYLYRETHFLKDGEDTSEPVQGSERLMRPGYSYSGMAYALSWSGALKLVREKPLQKMVPVDELLPIMYGQHPNKHWNRQFSGSGSMKAFAIHPRILEPYVYRRAGAITDTDGSEVVKLWENELEEQSCSADPALQEACQ
ncbi:Glycosyltransferase 25 family member [Amphibalanus amphitrite]|uniref:Glycosyltransferase 25 family member n=1 Tax=Amphibalanus amphitrite TaxID=1232801 RepID=A0A6A4VXY9_AMPAM|nr:glycosyltransferase 25 family member-like [Amphibalanus amphitrite]XP_043217615.1 glycosyltransferase 25 family member-like [Amphibalanus amphitrite]KAF0300807.1 Glycosyltransferase 25 family member [Amphibalanus amphitrite]